MRRSPILPTKKEQGWSETASAYRQSLHEDLYPKDVTWTPNKSGVTGTIDASYVRMGRLCSFGISIEGPTTSTSGYLDLPFEVYQACVFNVAVEGLNKAALVNKGESRLYLPDWGATSRAVISAVVVM